MDEMAESMEDVRGGGRARSIRGWVAVAAIGGCVVVDEPAEGLAMGTGSETLRGVPFVLTTERLDL
jgi:hypothetical protein